MLNFEEAKERYAVKPVFKVAVNRAVINKSKDWETLATGFVNMELTQEQLAYEINKGHAFTTHHNGRRKQDNFVASGYVALDFDKASPEELLKIMSDPVVKNNYGIFYLTPSSTETQPKFRVLFQLPDAVSDREAYKQLVLAFIWRFSATADESCKDPCRLFYGSLNSNPKVTGKIIPTEEIAKVLAAYEKDLKYEEDLRENARKISGKLTHNISDKSKKLIFDKTLVSHCDRIRSAEAGNRHYTLVKTARALGGYMAGEPGVVDEYEVRRKLEEAYSSHQGFNRKDMMGAIDYGLRVGQLSPLNIVSLTMPSSTPVTQPVQSVSDEVKSELFEVLSYEDLRNLPKPKWLVEPFLVEGYVACLFGPTQTAKSFWAIDLCLKLCHQGQQVMYLAGENSAGYGLRLDAWHDHFNKPRTTNFKLIRRPVNFLQPDIIQKLIDTIDYQYRDLPAPTLIVVDTLSKSYLGGDENDSKDMREFLKSCETLRDRYKCTVLVVHHSPKAGGTPRGSGVILGDFDTIIEANKITSPDPNSKKVVYTCYKQKDAPEFQPVTYAVTALGVNTIEQSCVLEELIEDTAPGAYQSVPTIDLDQVAILQVLDMELFSGGITHSALMGQLNIPYKTEAKSKSAFNRSLEALLKGRYILKNEANKNRPTYTITAGGKDILGPGTFGF